MDDTEADRKILTDLPVEILTIILSYLDCHHLNAVSLTCRCLYDAVQIEGVWETRAFLDFGVKLRRKPDGPSSKLFYHKVLWPYGGILGLWQRQNFSHYGSLHQVLFDDTDNWKLRCITWDPPPDPDYDQPLKWRDFITIQLSSDGDAVDLDIVDEFVKSGSCEIKVESKFQKFSIRIDNCPDWTEEPHLWNRHMTEFMLRMTGTEEPERHSQGFMLLIEKFHRLFHYRKFYEMTNLQLQDSDDVSAMAKKPNLFELLKPGIFKGTYGQHGIELINFQYGQTQDGDGHLLTGTKVIGDSNVPFGKISFKVKLSEPLFYTNLEDQMSIEALLDSDNLPIVSSPMSLAEMRQPFALPPNCDLSVDQSFTHCLARFNADCQVAGDNYDDPEFIGGQFIVFSEDTCGVLFIELQSFSLFHRVKENLKTKNFSELKLN